MIPDLRCERARPEHGPGLLALFESAGSGCFCSYWHFEGNKNAWLERCYLDPAANRVALLARLESPALAGVVASAPAHGVVGWLKVTRAEELRRLYEQRIYRSLPCFDAAQGAREHVYTVGCLFVAERARGQGVAKALLGAAIEAARAAGGKTLEAFPRGTPEGERLRPDEVWLGPEALFLDAGFESVSDFRPYPVLRKSLA